MVDNRGAGQPPEKQSACYEEHPEVPKTVEEARYHVTALQRRAPLEWSIRG
jgi:hypothetical protein